jgi:hypothetical protein
MADILGILAILLYIVALMLRWYQASIITGGYSNLPYIFRRGQTYLILLVVSFVFTYGSIVGIWYFYGIVAGLLALAIRFVISRVSFKRSFNREIKQQAEWEYRQMQRDRANANLPLENLDVMDRMMRNLATSDPKADVSKMDELQMRQEAYRRAREFVGQRMMRG